MAEVLVIAVEPPRDVDAAAVLAAAGLEIGKRAHVAGKRSLRDIVNAASPEAVLLAYWKRPPMEEARAARETCSVIECFRVAAVDEEANARKLAAAVSWLEKSLPIHPENLQIRSDRNNWSPRPMVFAPRIETGQCAWRSGCVTCAEICPFRAVDLSGVEPRIDRSKCLDCGLCMSACPVGAVRRPLQTSGELSALATGLLPPKQQKRIVLLAAQCSRPRQTPLPGSEMIELPCCGYISASLIVSLVLAGADAVVVAPLRCGSAVPRELVRRQVSFAARAVAASGIGAKIHFLKRGRTAKLVFQRLLERPAGQREPRKVPPSLGAQLRVLFGPAPAPISVAAEGFMGSVRATEACTLCAACTSNCITGALALDQDGSILLFDHSRCDGCGACVDICPEIRQGAISLRRVLEPARLAGSETIVVDEVAKCESCGSAIAPLRMLKRVQQKLETRGREAEIAGRFCPRCRITRESLAVLARPAGPRPPGMPVEEEADGGSE